MGLQSIMKRAAMAVPAAGLAFGIATQSYAQSIMPGCYPAATVKEALAQDNQQPIIVGNRISDGHPVNIFTSNPDGSLGYAIEGDATYGMPSTKMCVHGAYKNVRLNDPRNPEIPSYIPVEAVASGDDLKKIYRNEGRIIFSARTFRVEANGTQKLGKILAIAAFPDRTGGELAIDSNGRATSTTALQDLKRNDR